MLKFISRFNRRGRPSILKSLHFYKRSEATFPISSLQHVPCTTWLQTASTAKLASGVRPGKVYLSIHRCNLLAPEKVSMSEDQVQNLPGQESGLLEMILARVLTLTRILDSEQEVTPVTWIRIQVAVTKLDATLIMVTSICKPMATFTSIKI